MPSARRDIARNFASISRGRYGKMIKLDVSARQVRTAELDGTLREEVAGIDEHCDPIHLSGPAAEERLPREPFSKSPIDLQIRTGDF